MAIIIAKVRVDWDTAFGGFLPSAAVFGNGALYICELDHNQPHPPR
jgi:hypothetical protein